MALPSLPAYVKPIQSPKTSVTSRDVVNKASETSRAQNKSIQLAASDAPLRIVYGRDVIGGLIANVLYHGNRWIVQVVWGEGEIDGIESVQFGNESIPTGTIVNHYTGIAGQAVDPLLVAAFGAQSISYADTLPGIAYSAISIDPNQITNFPSITGTIRGLKVHDPRTGLKTYSTNPALQLADFLSNPVYGRGESVNWASVTAAADYYDELIGGVKRRECGVSFSTRMDSAEIVETLRTYAGVWLINGASGYVFVINKPSVSVRSFDHSLGQIESIERIRRRPYYDAPTRVIVKYTDTSVSPWIEQSAKAELPDIPDSRHRESIVHLPGIQHRSQALREATERLNLLSLLDLSAEIVIGDQGINVEFGDVISLTHPIGWNNKEFRILGLESAEAGRYLLTLEEYSDAAYSDVVQDDDGPLNTTLPNPSDPIAPSDLVVSEEVFQLLDGSYSSRFRVSWLAPQFPFVAHYRVTLRAGGAVAFTGTAGSHTTTWASPAVQEGVAYQIEVQTVSLTSSISDPAVTTNTALGKWIIPSDVPSLSGFEAGGEVRLSWPPAIDRDVLRYEVRYGSVGSDWDSAKIIDTVDALRLMTKDVPAGIWDFMVKAVDSVFQYSTNPARRTISVTTDASSFLVDTATFTNPTFSGMAEYRLSRTDDTQFFVTEDNGTASSKFTAALDSYTKPMSAYNSIASNWQTESYDFGLSLAGNWSGEFIHSIIDGASDARLQVSANGSTWTDYPAMVAKANGRFGRLRVSSASGSAIRVRIPTASVRVDAIPRTETGQNTSLASGPKRIELGNTYQLAKSIQTSVGGITAATAVFDNVIVGSGTNSFDVYIFDASGNQIIRPFMWSFNGV